MKGNKNMQNIKNVVTMSLDRYTQLVTDKYIAQEELRNERKKNAHINDMKQYLLKQSLAMYRIKDADYSLEELTDITGYKFGLEKPIKLLKLGFEYDEMINFITQKYEEFRKADEAEVSGNE